MKGLKEKIKGKDSILGMMLSELAAPNILRIMKASGFEYVIVDCEHGYFDFSQLALLSAVGKGIHMPVIVRIPSISREYITKVLDIGVEGILVPMINSAKEVEEVIKYAKYTPIGARGISTTRPHSEYHIDNLKDYMERANQKTVIMVQIETQEAVDRIESIVAVEGIDTVFIGPNDLAADMGIPGDFEDEKMQEAILKVINAADRHGINSGIITSNMKLIHNCRQQGMRVFSCSSEVGMMLKGAKNIYDDFHPNI